MKKLLIATIFLMSGIWCKADTTSPADQLLVTLTQHVIAISEFTTKGQAKLEFLDGIVQVGHYKNDYLAALDAGFCNSLAPDANGRLAGTIGIHFHVISGIENYAQINPALAQTLDLMELSPRVSFDTDVHKFIYGVTFGAKIPFGGQ